LSTLPTASSVLAQSGEDLATFADADRPIVYLILLTSLIALGFAALFAKEVLAAGQGTPKMIEIAKAVQEGAAAYLSGSSRRSRSSPRSSSCCCSCCPPTPPPSRSAGRSSSSVGAGFSASSASSA
jgi:K(+)-stimulated pyrophosphate-energized sodium pump